MDSNEPFPLTLGVTSGLLMVKKRNEKCDNQGEPLGPLAVGALVDFRSSGLRASESMKWGDRLMVCFVHGVQSVIAIPPTLALA